MTVLDTSGAIDFLLDLEAASDVEALLTREGTAEAPDLLVFEVLAVLRRDVARGVLPPSRAEAALEDIGDLPIVYYPALDLRGRAWALRDNLTAADALFVALAEQLGQPLASKDTGLLAAARTHAGVATITLGAA